MLSAAVLKYTFKSLIEKAKTFKQVENRAASLQQPLFKMVWHKTGCFAGDSCEEVK